MVQLLNTSKTADSDTAGGGIARQKGRIGMNRRVTRRTVTITIVSTLLLGLLATAAVARVFSLAPAPGVAGQGRVVQEDPDAAAQALPGDAAFCPGDCQLGRAGETDPIGASTVSPSTAGYAFPEVYGNDEASTRHQGGGPARPGAGVGPIEYLPSEEGASPLPSLAPEREADPDFGPQP